MATATGTLSSVGHTAAITTTDGGLTATVQCYGTFSGAALVFEISPDGTNWFATAAIRQSDGMLISTPTISAAESYLVPCNGQRVRVRLTAITSGSVSARLATTFVPLAALLPTQNTGNTGPILALNAITANASSSTFNLGVSHRTFGVQVILTGSPTGGTIKIEVSLDGTNFFGVATWTIGTQTSGDIIFGVDKPAPYMRATLAGLTGGTSPTVTAYLVAAG